MGHKVGVTRDRLVSVAGQLADECGFDQFTLAQVARRLGIRIPSVYNHVAGLPGLRRELALLGGRQILERINRTADGKSTEDTIVAVAQTIRNYAIEHPGLYAASVRAPAADDLEAQQFAREIVDVVIGLFAPYQLGERDAVHTVRALRSVIHGFVMLEKAGGFGMLVDREDSFQFLLESFLIGINARCKKRPLQNQ